MAVNEYTERVTIEVMARRIAGDRGGAGGGGAVDDVLAPGRGRGGRGRRFADSVGVAADHAPHPHALGTRPVTAQRITGLTRHRSVLADTFSVGAAAAAAREFHQFDPEPDEDPFGVSGAGRRRVVRTPERALARRLTAVGLLEGTSIASRITGTLSKVSGAIFKVAALTGAARIAGGVNDAFVNMRRSPLSPQEQVARGATRVARSAGTIASDALSYAAAPIANVFGANVTVEEVQRQIRERIITWWTTSAEAAEIRAKAQKETEAEFARRDAAIRAASVGQMFRLGIPGDVARDALRRQEKYAAEQGPLRPDFRARVDELEASHYKE